MAKVTITLEDKGAKTVTFLTEIEGTEHLTDAGTPAMLLAMATRAMFDNGILAEAAAVALAAINSGDGPSEAVLAYYALRKGRNDKSG